MKFKEWLLTEMHWRSLPKPTMIKGQWVDAIDFRFEDWAKGANPEKSSALFPRMNGTPYILGRSFSAPIQGRFINVNNDPIPDTGLSHSKHVALKKVLTQPEVDFTAQPRYKNDILLPQWYNFAALYLGNDEVKEPEWPRQPLGASKQTTPMKVAV